MFKPCFQAIWSILVWVKDEGDKDMLTMSAVLRPDVISSLWILIGPCVTSYLYIDALKADW